MDFKDWIRENNEKYGTSDDDWDPLINAGVVRFDYDNKGYVSGMYQGRVVYRDGNHELDINPGDIWIVSLSLNPKTGNNYFAKPLKRIDGSFLYEMKKDQIDALATYLWENNRVILEPALEEKYGEVLSEKIAKAVEEQTKSLNDTIAKLQDQIEVLEKIHEEDKRIIESKEQENSLLSAKLLVIENDPGAVPAKAVKEVPKEPEHIPEFTEQIKPPKNVIVRSGPDTIRSDGFKRSRYFVHLSADHRTLLIREDKNGNVVCYDNIITLLGLNSILPFTEECVLPSEYSSKYGGTLVSLK